MATVCAQYDKDTVYNAEELVAFVLSYAKQISEAHAG
jgi:molecular chaperone DnaK (HSP70)|tara:strand:+ start:873 stop:983 length:111 start_codon:yes stop_codon:yes gene_type:complete